MYENLGYHTFKIAGRELPTARLVSMVRAYTQQRYEGNLLDLLNGVMVMESKKTAPGVPAVKTPFIDNRKLYGFLDYFYTSDCRNGCGECNYCASIAADAVDTFPVENGPFMDVLAMYGKAMV